MEVGFVDGCFFREGVEWGRYIFWEGVLGVYRFLVDRLVIGGIIGIM